MWISAFLLLCGCSDTGSKSAESENEEIVSHEEPLSGVGMEKIIPLRFVNALSYNPTTNSAWKTRYKSVQQSVDVANQVFKTAGIQFYIKSFEGYLMPNFHDLRTSFVNPDTPTQPAKLLPWSTVRSELQQVLPTMQSTEWTDRREMIAATWLRAINTVVAARDRPEEYLFFITDETTWNGGSFSGVPETGRQGVMHRNNLGPDIVLAHELGHALGLLHTFETEYRNDPATNQPMTAFDFWDLYYKPGSWKMFGNSTPHVFFSSESQAMAYPSSQLRLINTRDDTNGNNCYQDGTTGLITCSVKDCPSGPLMCHTEDHDTNSPALKGLAFKYANSKMGANVMAYNILGTHPTSLSDTQILLIMKYQRWRVNVWAHEATALGKAGVTLSANLPLLGGGNIRQVAEKMDFDCDGKRDIGFWEPPTTVNGTGRFVILLSSKNFSTTAGQYMNIQLGRIGDIPLVGDFNNDCATDVATYQPGGGQYYDDATNVDGYWRWCPTSTANPANTSCTVVGIAGFGDRDDVPLAGLTFNSSGSQYLTTFNPRTGVWRWRFVNASFPVLTVTKTLGVPGSIPLPGLYDNDTMTDLAVYEPSTGNFKLLNSGSSWNSPITRAFGPKYVPQSGTALQRSGAIPLSGMTRPEWICPPGGQLCISQPRRVFSLYFPEDRSWNTMWDPIAGSTIDSCVFGIGAVDVPIPGLRINSDLYSDMAVFPTDSHLSPAKLLFKNSTPSSPGACNGSFGLASYIGMGASPRYQIFAVSDMTGDGKPDVMAIYPETMTVRVLTSQSSFTQWQTYSLPSTITHRAHAL